MLPTKLIDYSGQPVISLVPATTAAEAQARVTIVRQGEVVAQALIPASQMDEVVRNWRRARLEFPGEDWTCPADAPTGLPLRPVDKVLSQQLQCLEAISSALGDTAAAENFCEDSRINNHIVGNRLYQQAFWFCNASEHLGLAIGYLSKILDLED